MKNKTKNLFKNNLTDYFFQKQKQKIFLLHRSGNLVLFLHFILTSENPRKISFMASGIYAKITQIVLIHNVSGTNRAYGPKMPKKDVLKLNSNLWPSRDQKVIEIQTKALPMSYWSFLLLQAEFINFKLKTVYLPSKSVRKKMKPT